MFKDKIILSLIILTLGLRPIGVRDESTFALIGG